MEHCFLANFTPPSVQKLSQVRPTLNQKLADEMFWDVLNETRWSERKYVMDEELCIVVQDSLNIAACVVPIPCIIITILGRKVAGNTDLAYRLTRIDVVYVDTSFHKSFRSDGERHPVLFLSYSPPLPLASSLSFSTLAHQHELVRV